jgi:hypothetical protein
MLFFKKYQIYFKIFEKKKKRRKKYRLSSLKLFLHKIPPQNSSQKQIFVSELN